MGNFPVFPYPGCPGDNITNCQYVKATRNATVTPGSVKASPGYFSLGLESKIHVEMTVTEHTAMYRFNFSGEPVAENMTAIPLIVIDSLDLRVSRTTATLTVSDDNVFTGVGSFGTSFGSGTYESYFCASFQGATVRDSGVWQGNVPTTAKTGSVTRSSFSIGSWAQFEQPENGTILMRVGLSFISEEQACANAENEVPDFDFDRVVSDAKNAWRDQLSPIKVETRGVSNSILRTFWSGLYRTMVSPQDYTGENPLWVSDEPYYDSFYCIWDSFRTTHPLITLVDPESQARMVRALIDIYRKRGYLPDCRMSLCTGKSTSLFLTVPRARISIAK